MTPTKRSDPEATVLVVDDEVIVRSAIAEYLRDCGYRVLEAAHAGDAIIVLQSNTLRIDAVLSAVELAGPMDGFGLSRWVREHRSDVEMILAGTPARAAASAAELCDNGPTLSRPYDPQAVHDHVKRLLAAKKPRSGSS